MRISIGLVLLTDLFIRCLSIKAFFTNEGILPLTILKSYNWNSLYFSLYGISDQLWCQASFFLLNALCIVLLILGYRTRLFTFICWVFLVSIQNRNPFILQGGDDLLRLILLWGVFLPWGERYSIQQQTIKDNAFFSVANFGYIFLICSVYFFSAMLKTHAEWHADGTALYYALSLDQLKLPLGSLIYKFPNLMMVLTQVVYYIELVAPLLIMLPVKKLRVAGLLSVALLHLGIAFTLYVGLFYIIGLVTLIGLIPAQYVEIFERKFIKPKPLILEESPVLNGFIFESFYTLKNVLVALIFFYCLMLNLGNVKRFPYVLNSTLLKFGTALRLEQSWGMFSPSVYKEDGFFVFSGYTAKGNFIDVKHEGSALTFTKPLHIVAEFESDRWRKYSENYLFNNNNYIRPFYCSYLIKKWNHENPENKINDLTIFFMKEVTLPNYKTKPLEKLALCTCHEN